MLAIFAALCVVVICPQVVATFNPACKRWLFLSRGGSSITAMHVACRGL